MGSANTVVIDLTNYKDTFGQHVPPGDYNVVIEDAQQDKSSKKGTPMIAVWFRVNGGAEDGATIRDDLYLTEGSLFRLVAFLTALGMPTPRKKLALDINKFIGRHLMITVDDGDPYNGRTKSEVRGYVRTTPAESADLSDVESDDDKVEPSKNGKKKSKKKDKVDTDEDAGVIDLDSIDL